MERYVEQLISLYSINLYVLFLSMSYFLDYLTSKLPNIPFSDTLRKLADIIEEVR